MNEEKYIIKTENLSFTYYDGDFDEMKSDEIPALKAVNMSIKEGEYISVLGHNGSGKSTLAKLLNLILIPTSGKIYIDGKDVSDENLSEDEVFEVRKKIGMVFQNPDNQIVATVVEEDVAFGAENLGLPREEIRRRVVNALNVVGMQDYARHAPHKLSGGQKQRISIARALARKPEILILDDSTSALDLATEARLQKALREELKDTTVIMIAQRIASVKNADRIAVLENGTVTDCAPHEELLRVSATYREIYRSQMKEGGAFNE